MHEVAPIIRDLAVILGVASFVTLLFQYIKQPVVLGYLVAGVIVGPYFGPGAFVNDLPNIKVIAELGVIFLMFSLGLEFSFHKLRSVGFSASITGTMEVFLMMIIGFVTGQLIGWSFYDSLFLGAALSISSTTIIIKALEELHLKGRRFAELIFGVLIVEDLLAILLMVALSTTADNGPDLIRELSLDGVKLIFVVGSWFLIGYFIVPFLFRSIMEYANQETLTIVSIAFCLLLVCVASYFNYTPALGAFIMGSILAETPQIHRIEELIRPVRDIFAAVFFVSVGMLIDPKIIMTNFSVVILISIITVVGKIISSSLGALLTGQSIKTSLRVGFGMAQIGEFSFIIVALGLSLSLVSDNLYPIVVAVSAITTFLTPYLIRLSGKLVTVIESKLSPDVKRVLSNYSSWVYRSLADKQDASTYRNVILRFVVNGVLVAVIFTVIDKLFPPYLANMTDKMWMIHVVSWLAALLLSSPFIWAMLFAVKSDVHESASSKASAKLMIALIWMMVMAEVIFLSVAYFYTWIIIAVLFLVACLFVFIFYRRLEKFYFWFENNFIANINVGDPVRIDQFGQLAPWENRLVSVVVTEGSVVIGKTLNELKIRQEYGINIVAIQRHFDLIVAPKGTHHLQLNDKLVILGNDEQIEKFKQVVESHGNLPRHAANVLSHFMLRPILLNSDSASVGKTIRDSHIRERVEGIVVGLERHGVQFLNPDPGMRLEAGDLLYIVGKAERLKTFARKK